jgi:hypothetical protein
MKKDELLVIGENVSIITSDLRSLQHAKEILKRISLDNFCIHVLPIDFYHKLRDIYPNVLEESNLLYNLLGEEETKSIFENFKNTLLIKLEELEKQRLEQLNNLVK